MITRMHNKVNKTLFAARISNFNPVMQIIRVYKILLPGPNYQLKRQNSRQKAFLATNFIQINNTLAFRSEKLSIFVACVHTGMLFLQTLQLC